MILEVEEWLVFRTVTFNFVPEGCCSGKEVIALMLLLAFVFSQMSSDSSYVLSIVGISTFSWKPQNFSDHTIVDSLLFH
jgi:hypothetical protein